MFDSSGCFDIRSSVGIPVTNFTYRIHVSLYGSKSRCAVPHKTLSAAIKRIANENGPMTLGESWGRCDNRPPVSSGPNQMASSSDASIPSIDAILWRAAEVVIDQSNPVCSTEPLSRRSGDFRTYSIQSRP